jgi:hypothetical protein
MGEQEDSWQEWETSAGVPATVTGDADWGRLQVVVGTPAYGPVIDRGDSALKVFRVEVDRYGSSSGTYVVKYRGDVSPFGKFDISPNWYVYTKPTALSWRYVQLRLEEAG